MNDHRTGATLGERVGVVRRTQAGTRRHGDRPNLHRAEVRGRELRPIRQYEENALFLVEAQAPKAVANAVGQCRQLTVGHPAVTAPDGDLVASPFGKVPIDERRCEVVGPLLCSGGASIE